MKQSKKAKKKKKKNPQRNHASRGVSSRDATSGHGTKAWEGKVSFLVNIDLDNCRKGNSAKGNAVRKASTNDAPQIYNLGVNASQDDTIPRCPGASTITIFIFVPATSARRKVFSSDLDYHPKISERRAATQPGVVIRVDTDRWFRLIDRVSRVCALFVSEFRIWLIIIFTLRWGKKLE